MRVRAHSAPGFYLPRTPRLLSAGLLLPPLLPSLPAFCLRAHAASRRRTVRRQTCMQLALRCRLPVDFSLPVYQMPLEPALFTAWRGLALYLSAALAVALPRASVRRGDWAWGVVAYIRAGGTGRRLGSGGAGGFCRIQQALVGAGVAAHRHKAPYLLWRLRGAGVSAHLPLHYYARQTLPLLRQTLLALRWPAAAAHETAHARLDAAGGAGASKLALFACCAQKRCATARRTAYRRGALLPAHACGAGTANATLRR